jgi:pimeloyl-ACP methyl ester carboxylesterase
VNEEVFPIMEIPLLPCRLALNFYLTTFILVISLYITKYPYTSLMKMKKSTIVLVHGAFADGSSWNGVIQRLKQEGYNVIAPPNPLRGLLTDAAYISSFIDQIEGPILLVGHSYGGAVITNAAVKAKNVLGLVFVAAFLPDKNERIAEIAIRSKDSILNSAIVQLRYPTEPDGEMSAELGIDPDLFHNVFAQDLPEGQTAIMATTQRPLAAEAFNDISGQPAWKTIPSWAIVATEDRVIGTDLTRSMAKRSGANLTELNGSHAIMLSHPQAVTDVILEAADSVSRQTQNAMHAGTAL